MRVCVINGSPKGEYSITLQTVRYLEARFPSDSFTVLHVGQKLRKYEGDFSEIRGAIEEAEVLLFSYPVYTFIAPYQLHRFIELLHESGASLAGKFATQFTTSKHFYDVTAHGYIRENCADLGLWYIDGLSADMDDLITEKGQKEAEAFWKFVLFSAENRLAKCPVARKTGERKSYAASFVPTPKRENGETVIVTNCEKGDSSLAAMIEDFRAIYPYKTKVVNIAEYRFDGGCLGCFRCAADGTCVYRDGFDRFLREEIQTGNAIVYAFSVKEHSMGASFKRYDDRQFCNGHRTVTMGMPMGYLINGSLENEPNLKMIIEGRAEVGGNFLAGCAEDAEGIEMLSTRLSYAVENGLVLPPNFYGVGGMKIFRDLIYLMRGLMKADHKFYKKHGIYDFPQKKKGMLLKMQLVGALMSNPKLRAKMGDQMNEGMIAPYKKVLDAIDKENS